VGCSFTPDVKYIIVPGAYIQSNKWTILRLTALQPYVYPKTKNIIPL